MVCYVKEPGSRCLTGPCAIAIQDAEWRRNKEKARMPPSCPPPASPLSPLPASLVSSMMAPFVLTTTEEREEKKEGRREGEAERGADGRRSKEDEASSFLLRKALRHYKCDLC